MKKTIIPPVVLLTIVLGLAAGAFAQPITQTTNYTVNSSIPDNNANGVASTKNFTTPILTISDLNVSLTIAGGFNGDLYGYLTHGSTGFSVLLNRVGRTAGNSIGFPDSGFNITLDDSAANGDLHNYRTVVNPAGGSLSGIWQPDARNVDPALTKDTDPRTAFLSSFNGLNPNGSWTLFVADLAPGGTATLSSWGLEVTGLVPEPATWTLLALGGFGLFMASRRSKKT